MAHEPDLGAAVRRFWESIEARDWDRELWVTSPYEEPAPWRAPWSRPLEV